MENFHIKQMNQAVKKGQIVINTGNKNIMDIKINAFSEMIPTQKQQKKNFKPRKIPNVTKATLNQKKSLIVPRIKNKGDIFNDNVK